MAKTNYQWLKPEYEELPELFQQAIQKEGLPDSFAPILWNKQIQTVEQLHEFLHPSLEQLHDPFLFYEMEKAVERVHQAILEGEKILIYGDYDADGITSTTIMKEALEVLGAEVETYLPNRFTDGYGPNERVYIEKINQGIQLIITVDNGVSGHSALAKAQELGVDVIVTDHHELPEVLPEAYAIIHPRHPKGQYPFGDLAGVGVAFKFICALLEEVVVEALDLVAIGTIADLVSLTDENRVLVSFGLQTMKQTQRIGLQELLTVSQVTPTDITDKTVGFSLAPRLNALGRLSDPNEAVTLLSTFDESQAKQLAQAIDEWNTKRKVLVEEVLTQALQQVDEVNQIHVLVGEDWHEGILGIVAGRIVQQTGKPTIVLTKKNEQLVKGSGRSIPQVDLFEALSQIRDRFESFGGHHSAVGLTFPIAELADIQAYLNEYVLMQEIDFTKGLPLEIAAELKIEQATVDFITALKKLAPFGMGNCMPKFLFSDVKIETVREIGAQKNHLKFVFADQTMNMDGIAFQFGPYLSDFYAEQLALVGELSLNEWNGNVKTQLMVDDYQIPASQIFDFRTKKAQLPFNNLPSNTLFLSFENSPSPFQRQLQQIEITRLTTLDELTQWVELGLMEYDAIVYLDCPTNVEMIKQVADHYPLATHYFIFEAADDAYLDGLGTREQYAKLFTFIKKQKQVDIRYKYKIIADYLNFPQKLLIFMIQVFFELKFVTIDDGVLRYVEGASASSLEASQLYQQRKQKMSTEAFLQLSDVSQLKEWFFS